MPERLRSTTPIARKVHYCNCCGAPAVQPGDKYERDTYVYDGRVYDWVSCPGCDSIRGEVWWWINYQDEGIRQEDYAEWASEHADHPEHGEAAKVYLARATNHEVGGGE